MRQTFTVLTCLLLSVMLSHFAAAEIYKTVDKNGYVTFTDTPPPNTNPKAIELKSLNLTPPPPSVPITQPTANTQQASPDYQPQILAPKNGTTLMPNERSISVSVSMTSSLQNDDILVYKLDGNVIEKTTELNVTINEPPRGEHSLTVEVLDSDGQSLATSAAVTVIVMRPIIKQPTAPPKQ